VTSLTLFFALTLPVQTEVPADLALLQRRVEQLVRQLDADDRSIRDAAEQDLQRLGVEVLPLLPPVDSGMPAETQERLARVRQTLERAAAIRSIEASRLTLEGHVTLDEFLRAIEQQTGNRLIDFRSRLGQSQDPLRIRLNARDEPFWVLLDRVLDQEGLSVYNYVGEPRVLGIVQRPPGELARTGQAALSGPFRIEPIDLTAVRSLRSEINCGLRLRLEVLWEPRLAPLLLRQDYNAIHVTGDDGQPIEVVVGEGSVEILVQSTVAGVEFTIPLELPPRSVDRIERLEGRLAALVPCNEEVFEFTDLVAARNVVQQRGGLQVTLDRVRKNGAVYEFRVRLRMPGAEEAFQSHLDWVANNVTYLVAPDGTRIENPNLERFLERSDEVGYAYLFPVTGELTGYRFVYQSPVAMIEVPVDYQIDRIALP
jgi:hypothetical protein